LWSGRHFPAFNVVVCHVLASAPDAISVVGRVIFFVGCISNREKRFCPYVYQAAAAFVLSVGALARILYLAL